MACVEKTAELCQVAVAEEFCGELCSFDFRDDVPDTRIQRRRRLRELADTRLMRVSAPNTALCTSARNLREQSLGEVWSSDEFRRFYGPGVHPACQGCDAFMHGYADPAAARGGHPTSVIPRDAESLSLAPGR